MVSERDRIVEALYEVAERARLAGIGLAEMRRELKECWAESLRHEILDIEMGGDDV